MNKSHTLKSKMDRRRQILELLEQDNVLSVAQLSQLLQTSVVTIRKDLVALDEAGLLQRTHGGALTGVRTQQEQAYAARKNENRDAKLSIAMAAAELVHSGESLFIPTGTTCGLAFEQIAQKNSVIVISNSLRLFNQAVKYRNVDFFFLGGRIDHELQVTVGDDVIPQLGKYTADKVIMGADGVDLSGVSSSNYAGDFVLRQMIRQAREKILLADSAKLKKVAFAHFAELTDFDLLITNRDPANEALLGQISRLGLRVIAV